MPGFFPTLARYGLLMVGATTLLAAQPADASAKAALDVRDHGLRVLSRGAWSLPDGLHWPTVNGHITGDLFEEIRHFAKAVREDRPFVISVEEAMRAVAVNDAILRSVESGVAETVEDWRI